MSEPQRITEESGVHKAWRDEARQQTLETLPEFLRHLTEDYHHDYGTICHAIAAAMTAAGTAVNKSPAGGITGFQAGCVAWGVIRDWMSIGDGPARITEFADLLYPQYEHRFRSISKETWEWVQKRAKEKLAELDEIAHPDVRRHMKSVAAGNVPFGLTVEA